MIAGMTRCRHPSGGGYPPCRKSGVSLNEGRGSSRPNACTRPADVVVLCGAFGRHRSLLLALPAAACSCTHARTWIGTETVVKAMLENAWGYQGDLESLFAEFNANGLGKELTAGHCAA